MKTLLLIDVSGLYWANYHATADQAVGEAYERTVAKVHSLRAGYDHVVVCVDSPPYARKDLLPEYKAHREAAPPLAVEQFRRVRDRLRADGLLLWAAKGAEADDVIAFATEQALLNSMFVTIASGDKDLLQLVGDNVRCLSPLSGVMYTAEQVFAKFGVSPDKVGDLLALMGDKSDGVPGVPGVGPKTGAALLNEYGSLEAVLAEAAKPIARSDADETGSRITKAALKAALASNAESALLARRVIALRTDLPIDWKEIYVERTAEPLAETRDAEFDEDSAPAAKSEPAQTAPEEPRALPNVTALATVAHTAEWSLALEPNTSKGAWTVAGALFNSRLYQNFGSHAAVYAVLMRGRAIGLDATTSLAVFHNLKGKLTMHADLIEALVLRSGKAEYFDLVESSASKATYATKRVGARREVVMTFTIEDAFYASLVKKDATGRDGFVGMSSTGEPSNWDKYRSTMLRHRAKTQLCRAVYSDVVLGLYSPDELDSETVLDVEGRAA